MPIPRDPQTGKPDFISITKLITREIFPVLHGQILSSALQEAYEIGREDERKEREGR